jgi:gamma-glutamyltranspeptidase/glutathione hydrolase
VTPLVPYATRHAARGMVCSPDHLASTAGVEVMAAGGNAADAAVAASAVLAVTSQHMCGMGGDLFALVHTGPGAPAALNASGRAGSGADARRLRAEGHVVMPPVGDVRAVPVPGCVDGWLALHSRFGRLPLADVFAPARRYALDGFPASHLLALAVALVAHLPESRDYLGAGPLRPGALVRRPGVARALDAVVAEGRDGFYQGEFGQGLLTVGRGQYAPADLESPLADWVDPIRAEAWGHTVWTVPPNSQGYLTLTGSWIAAGLGLPEPDEALWAHLTVEAARQAGWDRLDALHEHADGAALVHPDRLAPRRAAVCHDEAAVLGREARPRHGDTVFLCAVDDDRMGVSLIQSNAGGWGALVAEPSTHIFLQNRGIGFSLAEGHPAEYGPRRRPPHTLSPALVTRADGSLAMVVGTEGGDAQPQVLLQLLARVLGAGQSPGQAMAAPRWALTDPAGGGGFHTWRAHGDVRVRVEGHAPPAWGPGLEDRGHKVQRAEPFALGFGQAQLIQVAGDHLAGASDPRARDGGAVGR